MNTVSGAELVAENLRKHDIDHFFNVVGFGIFPLAEAIHNHRDTIRYISGTNETAVSLVAEGYARATRRPAFLNVYHSSGTSLAMLGVSIAWADRTPLILTSTTSSRELERRDQYAAVPKDLTEATDQYTKWSWKVPTPGRIPEAIDRAVMIATTPPMGPVHLTFPMDLYTAEVDVSELDDRRGHTNLYNEIGVNESGITEAAELLIEADRPIIVAGGEVGQHYATDELTRLAEALGAGVFGEGATSSYLPIPSDHPLYVGDLTDHLDLAEDADVVCAVSFEFTEQRPDQYPFRNFDGNIIQIASRPHDIAKQVSPDLALQGHPKPVLAALADQVEERESPDVTAERAHTVEEWSEGNEHLLKDLQEALDGGEEPIAREVVASLRDVYGDDLVIVNQATGGEPYVRMIDHQTPNDYYKVSQKASAQGWGPAAAIGVQLGSPDRDVICIVGDGGFMFTAPTALYTAAHHKIPVTVIVLTNEGWGGGGYNPYISEGDEGDLFVGGFEQTPIDITSIADGLGIQSQRIESIGDVGETLREAREHDGPVVLDVPLSKAGTQAFYDYYLE